MDVMKLELKFLWTGIWPAFWLLGANSETVTWPRNVVKNRYKNFEDKIRNYIRYSSGQVILVVMQLVKLHVVKRSF
jgi:hypothetical protein